MSYAAALDSLHARVGELHAAPGEPRRKFRLEEMRALVEALGHPERRFRSILIAGTNGKGSTAATLAAILKSAGYKCGLYTSPHLVRVNERIRIDGEAIGDEEFARHYFRVDDCAQILVSEGKLPGHPSFFEALTAVAFEAFADAQVDLAVLEVGMGGRLDATNVVEPLISVITDISLDHTEWLGETIPLIAREKAGILRRNGVMVTLPQHPEANRAIGEVAAELDVRGVNAAEFVPSAQGTGYRVQGTESRNRYALQVMGQTIQVDSPLAGEHQRRNIALAIAAAVELNQQGFSSITPKSIERGVRETHWPGRFQVIAPRPGWPEMVIDVAHNPAGAWALRSALSERYEDRRLIFVFGAMRDKAISEMAEILFPLADRVIATRPENPRAASPEEIQEAAARTGAEIEKVEDVQRAVERARNISDEGTVLVITGSIYLVGEVMNEIGAQA